MAEVSRSGYYNWIKNKENRDKREEQDKKDFEKILEAYTYTNDNKGVAGSCVNIVALVLSGVILLI